MAGNNTQMDFPSWIEPFGLRVFRLVCISTTFFASLLGNSLVIKTIFSLPRSRTPFTYKLVLNLAIAELVNNLMLPFLVSYSELHTWIFGQFGCQVISPLQILANSVITSTLATIAASRCYCLLAPQRATILRRQRITAIIILLLWLSSLALSFPNFLYNIEVKSPNMAACWCITLLPNDVLRSFPSVSLKALILVQIVFNFLVNSAIMIISYGIVLYKVHSNPVYVFQDGKDDRTDTVVEDHELQDSNYEPAQSKQPTPPPPTDENENEQQASVISMDNDLFKMVYAIIIIFIGCYFPYQIMFILEYFGVVTVKWKYLVVLRKYLFLLTCFPSALHPLCYGLMTKFYAKAFSKILLCK